MAAASCHEPNVELMAILSAEVKLEQAETQIPIDGDV